MYIVSFIIIACVIINYFLGYKLYEEPKNEKYFNNVNNISVVKDRYILPEPRYTVLVSVFTGVVIGLYLALAIASNISSYVIFAIVALICICYLIEITRAIVIRDGKLILSKIFSKKIEINLSDIKGIYLYSYNKKFLNKHALTTKVVVVTRLGKTYKFTLSSLSNKSVLNMIKENFGVTEYKMYISKKSNVAMEH